VRVELGEAGHDLGAICSETAGDELAQLPQEALPAGRETDCAHLTRTTSELTTGAYTEGRRRDGADCGDSPLRG
jgi:hypothetical protein